MPEDTTGSEATERLAGDVDATRRVPPPGPDSPTVHVEGPVAKTPDEVPARIGAYEIRAELGRGGMGVVYRAFDPDLRREVALKVLLVSGRVGSEAIERFHREARAAAKLSHPGIVQIHDVGEADGKPYYTMELLPGRGLDEVLREPGLAPREVVDIIRQVATALHYAHERGVLHRDIKPRNIVVIREGVGWTAKVVDFGLAKMVEQELRAGGEGSSGPTLTRTGEVLGTPVYMSPEQVRSMRAVDARSDVYSLGATLYEALTGRVPFDRATLAELFQVIVQEDPVLPRRWKPVLDGDVETICLRCLQKDPGHRYTSAGALAEDCRRWLDGEPISARRVGLLLRTWRRARRNKAVAIPMGVMAFLLVAVLAAWAGGAIREQVRFRSELAEARSALADGRLPQALVKARSAVAIDPEDSAASGLLADVLAAKGRELAAEYDSCVRAEQTLFDAAVPEGREARWQRDAKLHDAEANRGTAWSQAVLKCHEALTHDPVHAASRSELAELYWDELVRAERRKDHSEAGRYTRLVQEYGNAAMKDRLRGVKTVRVEFRLPAGIARTNIDAYLFEWMPCSIPPVLALVPIDTHGGSRIGIPGLGPWEPAPALRAPPAHRSAPAVRLPLSGRNRVPLSVESGRTVFCRDLPKGSYVLLLSPGQGLFETRYPFEVAREESWNETCDLAAVSPPAPPGEADSDSEGETFWVFVPAGPYRSSNDPACLQVPPRRGARCRVPDAGAEGFFLTRFEVSTDLWLAYLNDGGWHEPSKAWARIPRRTATPSRESAFMRRDTDGRFSYHPDWWGPHWSISGVSPSDAEDFCAWLTRKTGGGVWTFRLPTEDEWEKAARGPDGRCFPWGDTFDPSFCCIQSSRDGLSAEPPGAFPIDESPYGVRDLAGVVSELTSTRLPSDEAWRVVKGGAWNGTEGIARAAARYIVGFETVENGTGFRIVAERVK